MRRRVFFLIAIIAVFIISGCDYEAPETSSAENPDTEITQENDEKSTNDKEAEAETEQKVQTLTTTADLNIRAGIGTSYDVVYVAPKGKELEMTGNSEQSGS